MSKTKRQSVGFVPSTELTPSTNVFIKSGIVIIKLSGI